MRFIKIYRKTWRIGVSEFAFGGDARGVGV
jgi:hypothetical protein